METSRTPSIMDISVEEFYSELDRRLRGIKHMNLARWKIVKNTGISLAVAWMTVEAGGDPAQAMLLIALINGADVGELAAIFGGPSVEQSGQPQDDVEPDTKKADDSKRQ